MSEPDSPKRGRKKTASEGQPEGEKPPEEQSTATPGEPVRNPWLPGGDDPVTRRSANIEQIFRQRRSGGNGRIRALGPSWLAWAALGIVSAWLASTSVHVLAQGERGIVTTLGRYAGTIGPGLHLTMPWPVQHVARRDVGKELVILLPDQEAETLMLTRDGELIDVRLQLRWRISDLRAFSTAFPDGEAAMRRLGDAAIRSGIAELTFDDIRSGKRQTELQQRVGARLQRVLDAWHAGVTVAGVEVLGTNPPAKLAAPFKDIAAETDKARSNHEKAITWAGMTRYNAETEAAEFDKAYSLYRAAPAATRTRMYLETMEKVLRNNPVVLGGTATITSPPAAADTKAGGR
jgi:modulator of FtsH protease HflK